MAGTTAQIQAVIDADILPIVVSLVARMHVANHRNDLFAVGTWRDGCQEGGVVLPFQHGMYVNVQIHSCFTTIITLFNAVFDSVRATKSHTFNC